MTKARNGAPKLVRIIVYVLAAVPVVLAVLLATSGLPPSG